MKTISSISDCCGCTACKSICPQNAISMKPDSLGFLYPYVDNGKCINCGLCEKVCDFAQKEKNPLIPKDDPIIYAVRHKNMMEVRTSRSGAACVALVDWILSQNGVIYGCGFEDHFHVIHKKAITKENANEFKGSKYVQSDLKSCFIDVVTDLRDDKFILFTGTGCQIAGLLSFLSLKKVDTKKLYTCDIVCHGVPGPRLWQDYLENIEAKIKKRITKVDFRDKEHFGWTDHKESFYTDDSSFLSFSKYSYIFRKQIAFRYSCYKCPYASTQRVADFTLADYWGYEKKFLDMGNDDKGLSLLFINSEKASLMFDSVKSQLIYNKVNINDCMQPNLSHPSYEHPDRNKFQSEYEKFGFDYILRKYGKESFLEKLKRKIVLILKRVLGKKKS